MEIKSVNIFEPGKVGMTAETLPELKGDEVLCEIRCVGICGTDHGIFSGEFSELVNFPLRPGHEWTGVVKETGSLVTSLKPGDRVVGETMHSCGVCPECAAGNKRSCLNLQSVGTVQAWPGAMADYAVFAARDVIKLPDNISFEQGALIEPAANALMAIDDAGVSAGDTVLITGTGPIGVSAAAIARLYGATTVISVGRSPFKLELCKKLGATHTINTREVSSPEEEIFKITGGRGVDVSIELSGSHDLFRTCVKTTRAKGILCLIAFYASPFEIDLNELIFAGINLRTAGGGWGYFDKVIKLMKDDVLDLTGLITSRISLEEAPDEIKNLKKDNSEKIKVMICNQA